MSRSGNSVRHVFIIGSRGLPAKYGGFETFVENLVSHQQTADIQYHVACLSDSKHHQHVDYKGADCFYIKPPKIGPARVIAYDLMAIAYALTLIKKHAIESPIFYILGNTIGGLASPVMHRIHRSGGKVLINPDGLEWKRSKWSAPVRGYLKYAEKQMVKRADLVVADNAGIEAYIHTTYPNAHTTCIAYGTETRQSGYTSKSPEVRSFLEKWQTTEQDYYLIVGRFVPENNYEAMIRAFMASKVTEKLLIVCNHDNNPYLKTLQDATGFEQDDRICFVGTVYDQDLLRYIRQEALAYIHGHEVGGTNPGLLEAMAYTPTNLVLDVVFNRETAKDTVYYWQKSEGKQLLTHLIEQVDANDAGLPPLSSSHQLIQTQYSWETIVGQYERLFLKR